MHITTPRGSQPATKKKTPKALSKREINCTHTHTHNISNALKPTAGVTDRREVKCILQPHVEVDQLLIKNTGDLHVTSWHGNLKSVSCQPLAG